MSDVYVDCLLAGFSKKKIKNVGTDIGISTKMLIFIWIKIEVIGKKCLNKEKQNLKRTEG